MKQKIIDWIYLSFLWIRKVWVFFALFLVSGFCCLFVRAELSPKTRIATKSILLYSNQSHDDLRALFVKAILQAKESIHLRMFGISDPIILGALQERIQNHIPVSIYYDAQESAQLITQLPSSSLFPVVQSGLMHQKILIIDRSLIFIGSSNMTTSSLLMHDNLVVGIYDTSLAEKLILWRPNQKDAFHQLIQEQGVHLYLFPGTQESALLKLIQSINEAKYSIKIALFTLTHPLICDSLIEAHHRGISVSVVIDSHSGMGASAIAIERLQKAGINVHLSQGVQLLHHKFTWIDETILITGSANWTRAAFEKNSDCLLFLDSLDKEQQSIMQKLWHRIYTESAKPNTK